MTPLEQPRMPPEQACRPPPEQPCMSPPEQACMPPQSNNAHPPGATTPPGSNHACPLSNHAHPPPGSNHAHPPVNRMTNWCKNITLPQTSFAGGNEIISLMSYHILLECPRLLGSKKVMLYGFLMNHPSQKARHFKRSPN